MIPGHYEHKTNNAYNYKIFQENQENNFKLVKFYGCFDDTCRFIRLKFSEKSLHILKISDL